MDLHEEGNEARIPVGKRRHVIVKGTRRQKKFIFVRFRGDFRGTGRKERLELADENGVYAMEETRVSLEIGRTVLVEGLHHRSQSHVRAIGRTACIRRCV